MPAAQFRAKCHEGLGTAELAEITDSFSISQKAVQIRRGSL
jgi:hypothetical protein